MSEAPAAGQSKLELLPNEVLQVVWIHLDDPAAWSLTSKRLRELSEDEVCRAKWFMQRYPIYEVMFQAICRLWIFSPSLFELLVRFGAPLSRNVVQLLYVFHNSVSKSQLTMEGPDVDWGQITFVEYVSVMQHAMELYENDIELDDLMEFDSTIFSVWMEQQYDEETGEMKPKSSAKVRRTFRHGFMPLPLALESLDGCCVSPTYPWLSVYDAVQCDPQLTAAAVRNGMELEVHQVEAILEKWWEYFAVAETKPFIKHLQVDGVLGISKEFAQRCFKNRLEAEDATLNLGGMDSRPFRAQLKLEKAKCNLLKALDKDSMLPFKLKDVVEKSHYSY